MAITMGMTIAPKIEIYTQLICRAMPVEKSGVTVPPPLTSGATSGEVEGRDGAAETRMRWEKGEGFEWTTTATGKEDDESWAKQCHKSSAVQSAVARLVCSDPLAVDGHPQLPHDRRMGRFFRPQSLLSHSSMPLTRSRVENSTVNYHQIVGYNFLLLGPFLDGLVGGLSTAQATTNAYLSDCTPAGSRARVFSLLGGLLFAGIAVGPSIGSLLIARSGSVLLPFYVALGLHLAYLGLLMVFLPESLSAERKETARRRHEAEVCAREEAERNADEEAKKRGVGAVWRRRAGRVLARPFGFLRPVGLLLPVKKGGKEEEDEELRTNIEWGRGLEEYEDPAEVWARDGDEEGKERRDWGLTKIAGAYAAYMMIIAIMSVKLLYANYTFAWGPREDGFFLSYIGALRFFTLVGILPCFVSLVRRPVPAPVRPRPTGQGQEREGKRWDKEQRWLRIVHDSHFDLRLARLSLLLDLLGFLAFSLSSHRIPLFLFATALQSLGSGASPAIQSLALAHSTPRDAGRLFASLSVVQSLASQVVGPVVFGLTFMNTVGSTPEAIFWLAGGLCAVSGAALCTVRLRRVWIGGGPGEEAGKTGEEEETEGPGGRGRSETRKRTNASEISLRSA
ncbi:SPOSA6832_03871, partial [Sporobolomyces salmonicolor]